VIIKVLKESSLLKEVELKKSQVSVGRSKQNDVVIGDSSISRSHLKIYISGGEYFIEDVSLSNWVALNQEKIPKNQKIRVFDFSEIELGDRISLKIESKSNLSPPSQTQNKLSNDFFQETTNLNIKDLSREPKSKGMKKEKIQKKDKRQYFSYVLIIMLLAIGGYNFYAKVFESEPGRMKNTVSTKQEKAKKYRSDTDTKSKNTNNTSPFKSSENYQPGEPIDEVSDLRNIDLCLTSLKEECLSLIFPNKGSGDALIREDETTLVAYKDYFHNLDVFFFNDNSGFQAVKDDPRILKVLAAFNTLTHRSLKKFEELGYLEIIVIVYLRYANSIKVKGVFKIETNRYRRFFEKDYNSTMEAFKRDLDFNNFERSLGRHFVEVGDES
tara:strand:- start:1655 stop:2806 length:1152 start_codon:yes stop_codon:yes gene_type:complete